MMLVAKNITYKYYKNAKENILTNVNISLKEGSITLLHGKSGSGKSTLAYILAGLYPENAGVLESGEVIVDGFNVHNITPDLRVKFISMMFQNCDLQFCMQDLRNELSFCLENINVPEHLWDEKIIECANKVGATSFLDRAFYTLSGGEKQRCALACIFALQSKVIILDEAFANIDTSSSKDIINIIKNSNLTVLVIDHDKDLWKNIITDEIFLDEYKQTNLDNIIKPTVNINSEVVIQTKDLSIIDINYKDMGFKKGTVTAILGKSGCGKTTFFNMLIKKLKYSGEVTFLGKPLNKLNKNYVYNNCGIVFQNPANQFLSLTVYDEIMFSVKRWNKGKDETFLKERTIDLLKTFNLEKYIKYSPYTLSQGQQRRLAVLAMIASNQSILLLDEPTYGQDFENIENMMMLLGDQVQKGLTVIFTTHNEKLAEKFAHYTIRLGIGD